MKKKSVKREKFHYINVFDSGYTSYAVNSKVEALDYLTPSNGAYRFTIEFNDKGASIINLKAKSKAEKAATNIVKANTKAKKAATKPKLPSKAKIKKQIDKTLKKQVKKVVAKKGKVKSKK